MTPVTADRTERIDYGKHKTRFDHAKHKRSSFVAEVGSKVDTVQPQLQWTSADLVKHVQRHHKGFCNKRKRYQARFQKSLCRSQDALAIVLWLEKTRAPTDEHNDLSSRVYSSRRMPGRNKTRNAPKSGGQQSSSHNKRGDPFNVPRVAASQRRTRIDIPLHQQVQDFTEKKTKRKQHQRNTTWVVHPGTRNTG